MTRGGLLLAAGLGLVACSSPRGVRPPAPARPVPGPVAAFDPVAEARALLLRTYRQARASAQPDRDSLVRLLGIDPLEPRGTPVVRGLAEEAVGSGLRIETLEYLAEPGVPVPATLWLPPPAAGERVPAVVVLHGHVEGGRSAPAVRERCAALADAGIAALALDLFGQGERAALGHRESWPLTAAGDSVLALDVRAIVRALDLLGERADVDSSRLGLLGQSGGAIAALHAAAIDARAKATFSASGLHDWEGAVLTVPQCTCNHAPGQLRLGTVEDAATLIPPRRLAVSVGSDDRHVPASSARAAFERARAAGRRTGAPESVQWRPRPGEGHAFTPAAREAALAFFAEAFGTQPSGRPTREGSDLPWTPAWPDGPPASALSLAELGAREQRAALPAPPLSAEEGRRRLRELLALPEPAEPARRVGERFVLETEPGFHLLGWARGSSAEPATRVLLVDSRGGRAALEDATPPAGRNLWGVDLRGQGDSAGGAWDYLQLVVGSAADRPLLGRRVHDLRGWLATLRAESGGAPARVRARGEAAFAALLLAALEPQAFDGLSLELRDLPATLVAGPGDDPRWGLPQSLAVAGLAELGDVADFARWIPAELRDRIEVESLRARDGRVLAASEPSARGLLASFPSSPGRRGRD